MKKILFLCDPLSAIPESPVLSILLHGKLFLPVEFYSPGMENPISQKSGRICLPTQREDTSCAAVMQRISNRNDARKMEP
jgi:hypothetical protein